MQRYADKTVVVTDGGGGIGGAACRRFAAEGARVAVFDRNLEAATEAQLGRIAVLVNNAGWDVFKPFVKTVPAEWERLIAINLTGALHMHHAVLPGMVERQYGRIVNIASDAARGGSSGEAVYAACKGGLVALSKTLAREYARHGITANAVCPGPTDTTLLAGVAEGARDPATLIEAYRLLRPDRAQPRLRPRQHDHARQESAMRLQPERRQDVDHQQPDVATLVAKLKNEAKVI